MAQTQFYQDRSAGIIVGGTRMDYISEFFISGYGYFVGYAALFMAVLIAVTGFHYLHTRKGADQIHSLPVKRSHFFFVIYTNGLLIWFLPLLLSSIVVLVLGFSVIGSASAIALAVVKGLLSAAFMFLVVYHFALVCMMISGNLLNTFFAMGVLGVGIAAAYFLVYLLFGEYLYSFYAFSFSSDMIMWLSPIVSAIYILMMPEADGYQFGILLSSALFMVFHLYLAWKWYVKRKSELAGAGIENRWMQRLLRSLVTFLAGLAGALFFRLLLFQGDTKITGLTIFGCLLGAVLSYGIANMIFAMSFRAFLQHKAQMVVCCGATLVVFLCIAGGWFGYNSWLPDEEDIQSATFYVDSYHDNSFRYYQDASGMVVRGPSNMILQNGDPTYQPIRKTDAFDSQSGNMHYTDVSSIHLAMESLIQKALPSRYYSADNSFPFLGEIQTDSMVDVNVKITLKSGIDIFRTFVIEGMDYENLWPIVDSPEYRYHFFRQSENQLGTPSISSITDLEGNTYHIESRAYIQA
jgi:ABC-2 type transport system permease protein